VHLVQRVTHQHTHDTLRQQSDTPPGCQPGHKQASPWGVYTTCHTSMIHNTLCTWPPGIPATSQELHVPGLRQGLSTLLHQIRPAMPPCSTQTTNITTVPQWLSVHHMVLLGWHHHPPAAPAWAADTPGLVGILWLTQ
jgi:hypothetical protein